MNNIDYKALGLKAGVEVHQQIYTEKKMFCNCPAGRYTKDFDAEIVRHMRPTLSELGEYDGTALMEFKTKKNVHYLINDETVCTYEMDDTPPFLINDEALDIALEIGMLFGCNLVDELHNARKQYLDGSIPTGFQRTAIFALDGKVPYKDRTIDIVQMSIEEDSCREVSDVGHNRVYLTDRLGMPLIETVTAPQMKTPHEVAEVAHILSKVVRSSNKVRRGMGAALGSTHARGYVAGITEPAQVFVRRLKKGGVEVALEAGGEFDVRPVLRRAKEYADMAAANFVFDPRIAPLDRLRFFDAYRKARGMDKKEMREFIEGVSEAVRLRAMKEWKIYPTDIPKKTTFLNLIRALDKHSEQTGE